MYDPNILNDLDYKPLNDNISEYIQNQKKQRLEYNEIGDKSDYRFRSIKSIDNSSRNQPKNDKVTMIRD